MWGWYGRHRSRIRALALLFALILTYQNCGQQVSFQEESSAGDQQALVADPPISKSELSYSINPASYVVNQTVVLNDALLSPFRDDVIYTIDPALPTGLTINAATGQIFGIATTAIARRNYRVRVIRNSMEIASADLEITTTDQPVAAPTNLSYSQNPVSYRLGETVTPNVPSATGQVTTYSVSPPLPSGLSLNTVSGVISGTPTAATPFTTYQIMASNSSGSTTTNLGLVVARIGAPFEFTLQTDGPNESAQLYLDRSSNYDFVVDWGDGSPAKQIKSGFSASDITHVYSAAGSYRVRLTGLVEAWMRLSSDLPCKITHVHNLGETGWRSLQSAFYGCNRLVAFAGGDVSFVHRMGAMFFDAHLVNPDISAWDTSRVTSTAWMFYRAYAANPDVSRWNTSSLTDMSYMFASATSANPDVSRWNTSNVTNMSWVFQRASVANPNVTNWDTRRATRIAGIFYEASSANPNVAAWNTANVTDMTGMFYRAYAANPDVSNWNTSKVIHMPAMFFQATSANPDVSRWDTSKVMHMYSMFYGATAADPDLSNWNITSLAKENADITTQGMATFIESNQTISTAVYSAMLIKARADIQAKGGTPREIRMDMGSTKHSAAAKPARDYLLSLGWRISDGGQE